MPVDDCYKSFDQLLKYLSTRRSATVGAIEDKNLTKATAEAWFRNYRPEIVNLAGETPLIQDIDSNVQEILRLSLKASNRSAYKACLRRILKIFRDDLLVELKVAEWQRQTAADVRLGSLEVLSRLEHLEPALEASYRQILTDLADQTRISFKGTANELREILREVLEKLASDSEVMKKDWFKRARSSAKKTQDKSRGPTQAERIRFITEANAGNSKEIETTQEAARSIDGRLGRVVRALYGRASSASHVQKSREEIISVLRYMDAVLLEILPSP